MKMQITGIEITEGTSKKSGNAYSMGTLHTMSELAPPFGKESNVAKGFAGDKLECDPVLLRKLQHLSFPLMAEVTTARQVRFGQAQEIVTDVHPLEVVKKAA